MMSRLTKKPLARPSGCPRPSSMTTRTTEGNDAWATFFATCPKARTGSISEMRRRSELRRVLAGSISNVEMRALHYDDGRHRLKQFEDRLQFERQIIFVSRFTNRSANDHEPKLFVGCEPVRLLGIGKTNKFNRAWH